MGEGKKRTRMSTNQRSEEEDWLGGGDNGGLDEDHVGQKAGVDKVAGLLSGGGGLMKILGSGSLKGLPP